MNGYSHAPEMAALSNALHLMIAGLSASPWFMYVPGKENPADIPSSVPFVRQAGSSVLDPSLLSPVDTRVIEGIRAQYRPMVLPTVAQLSDPQYFIRRGVGQ
jgi:hypothetical protein